MSEYLNKNPFQISTNIRFDPWKWHVDASSSNEMLDILYYARLIKRSGIVRPGSGSRSARLAQIAPRFRRESMGSQQLQKASQQKSSAPWAQSLTVQTSDDESAACSQLEALRRMSVVVADTGEPDQVGCAGR